MILHMLEIMILHFQYLYDEDDIRKVVLFHFIRLFTRQEAVEMEKQRKQNPARFLKRNCKGRKGNNMLNKDQYERLIEIQRQILRLFEDANSILSEAGIDSDGDTFMAMEDALDEYENAEEEEQYMNPTLLIVCGIASLIGFRLAKLSHNIRNKAFFIFGACCFLGAAILHVLTSIGYW